MADKNKKTSEELVEAMEHFITTIISHDLSIMLLLGEAH